MDYYVDFEKIRICNCQSCIKYHQNLILYPHLQVSYIEKIISELKAYINELSYKQKYEKEKGSMAVHCAITRQLQRLYNRKLCLHIQINSLRECYYVNDGRVYYHKK